MILPWPASCPSWMIPLMRSIGACWRRYWRGQMYVVSRQLERIGDNAVDIGEQVAFLVTGEFREFTDASHPEVEHPQLVELGAVAKYNSVWRHP